MYLYPIMYTKGIFRERKNWMAIQMRYMYILFVAPFGDLYIKYAVTLCALCTPIKPDPQP